MTADGVGVPTRARIATRFAATMAVSMVGSNTIGALVVYGYLVAVVPDLPGTSELDLVNGIVAASYFLLAVVVGIAGTLVLERRILRWFRPGHRIEDADRRVTVRLPARCVRLYGSLWAVAVVVFGAINLAGDLRRAVDIMITIAFGGVTTCALAYLLAERAVRPLLAEAMRDQLGPPPVVLGVRRRILLSWALGTAVPLAGVVLGLLDPQGDGGLDRRSVLFLCAVSLVVGLLAMLVAARSVSDPVEGVTRALAAVAAGDLTTRVVVDDVSELGRLQSGVNAMVAGLQERERLRDLYSRQVGADVAAYALDRGVQLGGERREVAVLFVDVVGSTTLAEQSDPAEVVGLLNDLFGAVVGAVEAHGGWVNKFEGDAALCVFGAPVDSTDPWSDCLAAARAVAAAIAPLPVRAAVGVSGGRVVAGHVGAATRFEYTVIGDPVNAAARLTELAKEQPGALVADDAVVRRASSSEQEHWRPGGSTVLRGRSSATTWHLAAGAAPPTDA